MGQEKQPVNVFDRVWGFFSSIRLSVAVLMLLAVTSIIGTLIPQNQQPDFYFHKYGEVLFRLFYGFDIFDMYHSWWFRLLILILSINLVVCSVERLSSVWKIVTRSPSFNANRFKKYPGQEITIQGELQDIVESMTEGVSRKFGKCHQELTETGVCLFSEKGRWTRLGVYVVHIGILVLIAGSLLGSIAGFEGSVTIPEGQETDTITLKGTGKEHKLDFSIRCDDFEFTKYDTGDPKEYRSDLTLLDNGKEIHKKSIIVNDPLRFNGINIYQSSFGKMPSETVTLGFTSKDSGMVYQLKASMHQVIEIPESLGNFTLMRFMNSYNFRGHNIGETYIGVHQPEGGEPREVLMPLKFDSFDKMFKHPVAISVISFDEVYYTGLQVTKDPGVLLVYAGFILLIIGCYIAFFMSHQSLCVELTEGSGGSHSIRVSGTANKNKIGMKLKVEKLAAYLTGR